MRIRRVTRFDMKVVIIGMVFYLLSCNMDDSRKVVMSQSTGLEGDNLGFTALMVRDRNTALIAGSSDHVTHNPDENSDQFAFVTRTATLARTVDGGKTWKQQKLGEGSILSFVQAGKKIFATKVLEEPKRNVIYSTDDWGETWKEERTFPERFTSLFATEVGYWAVVPDSGVIRTHLQISRDSGRTWEVQDPVSLILDAVKNGNKLVFLSCDNPSDLPRMNQLVEYDPGDKSSKVTALPAYFDAYFINDFDGNITLAGKQDDHLAVYGVDKELRVSLKYAYTAEAGYFPQGYFADGQQEWLIAGTKGTDDVSNMLLRTADNGKSWQKIPFEYPRHVKPFGFYSDSHDAGCWFFSGLGRLQKLEWKK